MQNNVSNTQRLSNRSRLKELSMQGLSVLSRLVVMASVDNKFPITPRMANTNVITPLKVATLSLRG